jgi:hypothetical protein
MPRPLTIPADAVLSHRSGLSHAAQRVRPYTLPRIDIQISGAIESIPGPMLLANYVASTAVVAPSLGRALVGGAQNITANIVPLGTLFGERLNQLDLRFGRCCDARGRWRASTSTTRSTPIRSRGTTIRFRHRCDLADAVVDPDRAVRQVQTAV